MTEQFTKSLRLVVKNGELKRLVVDEVSVKALWAKYSNGVAVFGPFG